MQDGRLPNDILYGELATGSRPTGRPALRYKDVCWLACGRPKRSTVEQIFNIKILIEKHLQHHRDLFPNFIDFEKAFDQVWHDGLWQVMRNYNIDSNIIDVIKALYGDSKSAVFLNNQTG
ncbi:hypothetical protein ACOMHN_028982 [Nucella lapillus]